MSESPQEIERAKIEAELKKTKIKNRYQLLITFLGTTLVTIFGSYFVFIEKTEKNLQDFDGGHRNFVSKFVDIAIDDDIERRQRLARYFATVTLDEVQRSRWIDYANYIDKLIEDNPDKIASLKQQLNSASDLERSKLESRIRFLEKQLNPSFERANVQIDSSKECNAEFESFPSRWRCIALRELNLGVKEVPGDGSNPRILDYAEFAAPDSPLRGQGDNIPWSGLFVAWVIAQSGIDPSNFPENPYHNRKWLNFGTELAEPVPGALAIFYTRNRNSRASVIGFFDGEDDKGIYIISGNVNDSVARIQLPRERLIGFRTF